MDKKLLERFLSASEKTVAVMDSLLLIIWELDLEAYADLVYAMKAEHESIIRDFGEKTEPGCDLIELQDTGVWKLLDKAKNVD